MKKLMILFLIISIVWFFFAYESIALRGIRFKGSGGWGCREQYTRMYNPQSKVTVTGEVRGVDAITPMKQMSQGMSMILKTVHGDTTVHLGPVWFMENQEITIEQGDRVEIRGSRITLHNEPVIICAEVRKGDHILRLRDEAGFPVWSAWRPARWGERHMGSGIQGMGMMDNASGYKGAQS